MSMHAIAATISRLLGKKVELRKASLR